MDTNLTEKSAFYVRFNKGYELMEKYPEHVPVMFVFDKKINLEKNTIMCLRSAPLSQTVLQFRKYLASSEVKSSPTMGFIFHVQWNNKEILPRLNETMGDLHDKYHSSDLWLVVKIDIEDIFG